MDLGELRKRSEAFVRDMDVWIANAISDNEELLVKLNQKQMLASQLSTGKPIKPLYSKPYAKKKGFSKPNLKGTGDFQGEMFISTNENKGTYFFGSFDHKSNFLSAPRTEKNRAGYGEYIYGLTVDNKRIASMASSKSLYGFYKNKVLRK